MRVTRWIAAGFLAVVFAGTAVLSADDTPWHPPSGAQAAVAAPSLAGVPTAGADTPWGTTGSTQSIDDTPSG